MSAMTDEKPRREWRVTKASLEARVRMAEALAENRGAHLEALSASWRRVTDRAIRAEKQARAWRVACYALTLLPVVALGLALW